MNPLDGIDLIRQAHPWMLVREAVILIGSACNWHDLESDQEFDKSSSREVEALMRMKRSEIETLLEFLLKNDGEF